MRRSSRRDDFSFMQGNGSTDSATTAESSGNDTMTTETEPQLSLYVPKCNMDKGAILKELTRIRTMVEKYDLQEQPEVLTGLLDDFKTAIESGDKDQIIEFLKKPVVYGGIAAIFAILIFWKMSQRKKRKS